MKTNHSVVSCRRPAHFPTLFFVAILLIAPCLVRASYGFDDKALQEADGSILRYSSAWLSSFSQWPGSINKIGEMGSLRASPFHPYRHKAGFGLHLLRMRRLLCLHQK